MPTRHHRGSAAALALALGASLAGCSADGDVDTLFDPCSALTVHVDVGASDAEVDSVRSAVSEWSRVLPTNIAVERSPAGAGELRLRFESGDTFYRAIYWDQRAEIDVSRAHLDPADYPLAIAHELGHSFGLLHVPKRERASVMNVGNLAVAPSDDDAAAVRRLWPDCR